MEVTCSIKRNDGEGRAMRAAVVMIEMELAVIIVI